MTNPTVFISYSHKDEEWKDRLVSHLGVLQQEGLLNLWEDRRIAAGDDWYEEIEGALNNASVAVLMISANFLNSNFILNDEVPRLLERRKSEGIRVIPIIVKPCAWTQVKWLSPIQCRPKDGKPLSGGNEFQIDTDLAAIAEEIAKLVHSAQGTTTPASFVPLPPDKVSLAKLPVTGSDLFGRKNRLEMMTEIWQNPEINILSLVAWGGVGKSALVNKWFSELGENFGGAERVFGWSFYSQGAAEGRQVSADQFIAYALEWFGDEDPTAGDPWQKGERLAALIKEERTLLILDGLEPLQTPPPVETGVLKDPALKTLLRELGRHNPGLVVISTRLAVTDLRDMHNHSVEEVDLENLSPESGAKYLEFLSVDGTKDEREEAAKDFGGHALALTLLGSYLRVVHGGDIRKRGEIPQLTDERKQGAHARRVMESYEKWFADKAELDILRLMGLFDRPAEAGAIKALRAEPAIEKLTEKLQKLSDADWRFALESLREARLLAAPDPIEPDSLDCHPLLREHFGERLKTEKPDAWREAHSRLYEYYKNSAKELPDTLDEMAPLFAAVAHGCQAGRYEESFWEYYKRIQRDGKTNYCVNQLGAIGSDLAALSGFFDSPWVQPVSGLLEQIKAGVLSYAGFRLIALGRFAEAAQPTQAGLDAAISQENWVNAAADASSLSELYLSSGDVPRALTSARQGVELADKSDEWGQKMINRTTLANVLHQHGQFDQAEALFREAEVIQKEWQPEFHLLYSLWGFRYCDLLLSQSEFNEVFRRGTQTLEWAKQQSIASLLTIANEYISLGRAHLMQAQTEKKPDYTQAVVHLEQAVTGLRRAGTQHHIPRGLLARAKVRRAMKEYEKAQADLDEAYSIVTRGGMRLFEADCHLEYARLYLAKGDKEQAREHWEKAREMVTETGYHRRDREVEALEDELN
jgi:tetratricopeptide (TPR) repeat protein